MKVLLSIKPEYAYKILSGDKRYEFRKAVFKNKDVRKIVIYATKPVGKVVGEFDIGEILQDSPESIWAKTKSYSGISKDFFEEYFNGRERAFAISIKNPSTYEEPFELKRVVANGVAPQSFRYLHEA